MRTAPKTLFTVCLFSFFWVYACGTGSDDNGQLEAAEYPCIDGKAKEIYPCKNVDLYAKLSPEKLLGERLNDVWGWRDEDSGREFAIVGLTDGLSFVDITDPVNPLVVGKLWESTAGSNASRTANEILESRSLMHDDGFKGASIWRDMKVYRNHVFVVSEESGHGMQVFSLDRLLDVNNSEMPVFFEHDALYMEFETAHNIAINEETGFAYAVGTREGENCTHGGMHMVDIREPLNPQFAGCYLDERGGGVIADGYIHDTQCVIYHGPDTRNNGEEICFSSSELKFLITDVSDKSAPATLSVTGYDGAAYSHQGWLTEDHRYFLMNDELDEIHNGHPTRTYIWNVEDLEDPELVGFHDHGTNAVSHNLFIRDNYVYQGNYLAGLRILRLADLANARLEETGYFDTTPGQMALEFGGVWSVYPWFSGNTVVASDIHNGLFILKNRGE